MLSILVFFSSCIASKEIEVSDIGTSSEVESSLAEEESNEDMNRKDIYYEKLFDIFQGRLPKSLMLCMKKTA
jgi:hypothetical protein